MAPRLILGIESSCDETSAAVVADGHAVLSNVVASQIVHAHYGGVVPELASREHLRNIVPVVREALRLAGVSTYRELDAVAVTEGPGLAGALLVGISFAKALAFGADLSLIAINHLEGHIQAVLIEAERTLVETTPLLAAVISGGHSHLYLAERDAAGLWSYRNVGRTIDDAAGEAFDKVAKLLGLPYPGGPWIDALARHGDPQAVFFGLPQIKQKKHGRIDPKLQSNEARAALDDRRFDLSFSGLKTAVRRYVDLHGMREAVLLREQALHAMGLRTAKPSDPQSLASILSLFDSEALDLLASFQRTAVTYLARQTFGAARHFGARGVVVSGGVSANALLRGHFTEEASLSKLPIAFPRISLSTDNAAMIAAAAWPKLLHRRFADFKLEAKPNLRLGG